MVNNAKRHDYKSTLNLPRTEFSMKAQLPRREPEQLERWGKMGLYEKILKARRGSPAFVLHDGPPYANGNIHLGTALNKILKDFIIKAKTMEGFFCPYVPGWDCHGLPIELKAEEAMTRSEIGAVSAGEFRTQLYNLPTQGERDRVKLLMREACRLHAERFIRVQRDEFKRLGVFGAWEKPYLTMDPDYQASIVEQFAHFYLNGNVYRGRRPVYWCASCATALAEAEVEYDDHTSPSIYVAFPLKKFFKPALVERDASVLIWTTTPWTLPANLAIAFHPELRYAVVRAAKNSEKNLYILYEGLVEPVRAACGWDGVEVLETFEGKEAEGGACRHPFMESDSLLVLADYVTTEQGTGCVHTAPGHGLEDFVTGRKYGLEPYAPLDDRGVFLEGPWKGVNVFDANAPICARLREDGFLLAQSDLSHSYPHCWRCKRPVVFRSTPQWFISMEHGGLREKALKAVAKTTWIPPWGEERMHNTVRERPDWCISRQRAWGVPIPVFYCAGCEAPYATKETLARVAEVFREEGADSWYRREEAHFLPRGAACPKCGHKQFRREEDILDVWFDSGSSSLTVLEAHPDLRWPADVYLEGTDQYRGWFNSSLMVALRARGEAPYRAVVTHGFTVDERGHKMSKSLGNVIAPQEVEEKYGAEILRLWVAMTDYRSDMAVSHAMLQRSSESYRKIRNTCRYILGNLFDYKPGCAGEELEPLDQWALTRLDEFEKTMRRAYAAYEFHRAYHLLVNFCSVDLSAQYFDILKDRLYCSSANAPERRSAQHALHLIGASLARFIAPILPFTAEDVWQSLPAKEGREESVHLSTFEALGLERDEKFRARWDNLFRLRDDALKALELARARKVVGNSLAAKVALTWDGAPPDWVRETENFLPTLFIVSQVENGSNENPPQREPAHKSENFPGLSVRVLPAEGEKCTRCWMYSPSVGGDSEHPDVCARCVGVLGEPGA